MLGASKIMRQLTKESNFGKQLWESWGKCHFNVNVTSYKIYYREEGGASS
jgi:hypothetical protein